jgi:xylulokinase
MRLTGEITTTASALSEGILWDFEKDELSKDVMQFFKFKSNLIPAVKDVLSTHGFLKEEVADKLGLRQGIPVSYKAATS